MHEATCSATGAASDLRQRVHHTFGDALAFKCEWDVLARTYGDLYSSFDWCEVWWQHYGQGRRLEIHTLWHEDELVGVLPLYRETLRPAGVGLRAVRIVGSDHLVDSVGLALRPEHATTLLQMVLDDLPRRGPWDVLQIGPLRGYVDLAEQMVDACLRHPDIQHVVAGRHDEWLTHFELPEDLDEYLQLLPRNERRDTFRRLRRLEAEHEVEVVRAERSDAVESVMDAMIDLHQDLWAHRGQRGHFECWPGYRQFHHDLARRSSATGRLLLIGLKINGQIRGALYGYRFGGRVHALISGHDPGEQWRPYALGRQMHMRLVEDALAHRIGSIDDGRGIFEYKLRLGGRLAGERSVTAVRRGWASRLRFWAAMQGAYLLHIIYRRVWFRLSARLGRARPMWQVYLRSSFLIALYRRIRFRPWGAARLQEATCVQPLGPDLKPAAPADAPVQEVSKERAWSANRLRQLWSTGGKLSAAMPLHTCAGDWLACLQV